MIEIKRGAIFLDRDGVINYNRADHVKSWDEFEFLPGSLGALRKLTGLAWPIVVISNQAAIGRGLVSREAVDDIHRRMVQMVEKTRGRIDAVFYCPHRPDELCPCRKPNPGQLLRAAQYLHFDLSKSFLVGDAMTDIAAAEAVGCQPILVKTGRGQEQLDHIKDRHLNSSHVADDLFEAAIWIEQQVAQRLSYQFGPVLQDFEADRRQMVVY